MLKNWQHQVSLEVGNKSGTKNELKFSLGTRSGPDFLTHSHASPQPQQKLDSIFSEAGRTK